jgi:hypothetical protein
MKIMVLEKFSSSVYCGSIGSDRIFSEFIGIELDHTPKREIVPDDLLCKCENVQKILRSTSIRSMGQNRAIQPSFQTEIFPKLA